ncbi:sugar transferase [Roseiconus nitratireducens]|nr:sugar transferase [Roseiconus nitratireducens]
MDRMASGAPVASRTAVVSGERSPADGALVVGYDPGSSLDYFACAAVHDPVYRSLKRICDVVGALVGMIVLSPLLAIGALAVYLVDGGPVIFRQTRVGLDGREFTILKFRTMVKDAEARLEELRSHNGHGESITFKMDRDPRVIPWVGHFMRRTSIDELPQLWNVLGGEMSLVGPRPAIPSEVACYDAEHLVRLAAKPGLTCFWQVSGRGNLSFDKQFELDRRYIDECSLLTDLSLIVQTIPALLLADGAR